MVLLRYGLGRLPTAISRRTISTSSGPVNLDYTKIVPPDGNEKDRPLVILHGLFGSKRNWTSLTKAFARDLGRPIYSLDLRNHGTSPHALPMTYTAMASDVLHFLTTHSLTNVSLLGHSMGGKVAMALALSSPNTLAHLVVADIAPSRGRLSTEFETYVHTMHKIESLRLKTRKEATHVLSEVEKDPSVVSFLLTNLISEHGHMRFRVPIAAIEQSIDDMGSFPYEAGERKWEGKALFIKGTKSSYINRHNIPLAKDMFPNMVLETLDAGHWVHAERPNEFRELVTKFIS